MNSSQRFGLFILILISVIYVYFTFLSDGFKFPELKRNSENQEVYSPLEDNKEPEIQPVEDKKGNKIVKIFIIDKSGNLRSVNRSCDMSSERSCFEYAIKELLSAPSKWEKSKGFTSEIPTGTKLLSVRESSDSILLDISSEFQTGGGAESTYMRIKQIIKTVNSNSEKQVYLYINGQQVNVIGGEGVMLKQPLNERSLDE